MSALTNGKLTVAVAAKLATAEAMGQRPPGRRKIAAELGVSDYDVRKAMAQLEAERSQRDGEFGESTTTTPIYPPVANSVGLPSPGSHTGEAAGGPGDRVGDAAGEPGEMGEAGRPAGNEWAASGRRVGARRVHRWPLLLLALPAFVAIWGGWVGLGEMAGFGVIKLLPGIWDTLRINSAVTLPIGLETYAAYALHIALSGRAPTRRAQVFAIWSAVASLMLGATGQVAYHLMTAAGMTVAPWWITAMVATLPVAVLGMGAALAHLIPPNRGH